MPARTLAVTFGEHVFLPWNDASERTLLHEACHVLQYRSHGRLGFLLRNAWYNLRYGYGRNPFEIEAVEFTRRRVNRFSLEENRAFLRHLETP